MAAGSLQKMGHLPLPAVALKARQAPRVDIRVQRLACTVFGLLGIGFAAFTLMPKPFARDVQVGDTLLTESALAIAGAAVAVLFGRHPTRRAVCSNQPAAIPSNVSYPLILNGTQTDAYCASLLTNGTTLEAWFNQGNQTLFWRLFGDLLQPGEIVHTSLLAPGVETQNHQVAIASFPNGNSLLFVSYLEWINANQGQCQIDAILISPIGQILNRENIPYGGYNPSSSPQYISISAAYFTGGDVVELYTIPATFSSNPGKPLTYTFDSDGNILVSGGFLTSTQIANGYIAASGTSVAWTGTNGVGIFANAGNSQNLAVSSSTISGLAIATLPNSDLVFVWIDAQTNQAYFQIFGPNLNVITLPALVDPCTTETQADPQVIPFRDDSFIISLALFGESTQQFQGYRLDLSGNPILGPFVFSDGVTGNLGQMSLSPFNDQTIVPVWSTSNNRIAFKPYWVDSPPVIQPINNQTAFAGHPYSLQIQVSDPDTSYDGDEVKNVTVSGLPDWASFNPVTLQVTGTPGNGNVGPVNFWVWATDSFGEVSSEIVEMYVGLPPQLLRSIGTLITSVNAYFFFPVGNTFIDPQGGTLTYEITGLASWMSFQDNVLSFTAPQTAVGTYSFNLTATNAEGVGTSTTFSVNVQDSSSPEGVQINNRVPDSVEEPAGFFSYALPSGLFTEPGYNITLQATGPNGQPLAHGLAFDEATGTFTGHLPVGSYTIIVRGVDDVGNSNAQTFSFEVTDIPPEIVNLVDNLVANVGSPFNQQIALQDHYDLQVFSWAEISSYWLAYNNLSHSLTGTPGHDVVGPTVVTFFLVNSHGFASNTTITVNVQGLTSAEYGLSLLGYICSGFAGTALIYGIFRNRNRIMQLFRVANQEGVVPTLVRVVSLHSGGKNLADMELDTMAIPSTLSLVPRKSMHAPFQSGAYHIKLGDKFETELQIHSIPQLNEAEVIFVRGVKRVENGVETNKLPEWINHRIDKEKGVIKFFSRSSSDKELGRHTVVVVGEHLLDDTVQEVEYIFHITVSNTVTEYVALGAHYHKILAIDTIFPHYQEGDDIFVRVTSKKQIVSWLKSSIEPHRNAIALSGIPEESGEYEVALTHSRQFVDQKTFLFNISILGAST